MRLFEIETSLKQEVESFPYMMKRFVYSSSPLNFETKSGIHVTQHYKMPENLPVDDVYKYYSSILSALDRRKIKRSEAQERTDRIYNSVVQLNPELKTIKSDFQNAEGHVLTAALSLYNIDDIKGYVEEGKTSIWYINNEPGRYAALREIEQLTGAKITWVMSNKTFNRVYAEVCEKYKK